MQPAIPGLGLPASILSGPIAAPAPTGRSWVPENRNLLALFDGAENVVLREPMTRGSFKDRTNRSGEVRRVLTDFDFLPSPPGSRDVYASLFGDEPAEFGAPRQEYSDGTPVEQFIVNRRTGLPDDTAIYKRNKARLSDEEANQNLYSARESEFTAPVVFHEGGREFSIRYVDPTRIAGVEDVPPADRESPHDSDAFLQATLGREAQRAMQESKTGTIVGSALNRAQSRGRFVPLRQPQGSLVGYILDQGAQVPTGLGMRYADQVPAEELQSGPGRWRPVYNPGLKVERLVPIKDLPYEQRQAVERGTGDVAPVQENLYRIGSPLNRDQDLLRQGLRDAFGAVGINVSSRFDAPWDLKDRSSGLVPLERLLAGYDSGFRLAPVADAARPLPREALPGLVREMRGQADHPMAEGMQVLLNEQPVHRLVAERDAGGALTGRFYIGQEQEVGPAALLSDQPLRVAAEQYAKKLGVPEAASLERLAMALGRGGAFDPTFVPSAPAKADPVVAMLARSVLTDEELSRVPGVAKRLGELMGERLAPLPPLGDTEGPPRIAVPDYVATAGSAARPLLEQSIYDVARGAVPLDELKARLLYQAARDRSAASPSAPEDLLPPWEVRRRAATREAAEAGRRAREDHSDLPPATRQGIERAPLGPAQLGLPRPRGPWQGGQESGLTWTTADISRLSPNPEIEALEAYMARRASQVPAVVRTSEVADQLQLPLEPAVEQLPLFPATRFQWSPLGPEVHKRISHLRTASEVPRVSSGAAEAAQLALPLETGDFAAVSGEVRRSDYDPLPVGRQAGPYAGRSYYGLGGAAGQYQQPMTIAGSLGGFDYGQMVAGLGASPGTPEHSIAMAQLAKRVQARTAAQAIARRAGGSDLSQLGLFPAS